MSMPNTTGESSSIHSHHPKDHDHDHSEHDHDHPHDDHDHGDHDHSGHDHDHPHDDHDGHDHSHEHGHDHDHDHGSLLSRLFHLHSHADQAQALAADPVLADNSEGIRTVWLSLAALGLTTVMQIVIFALSGSVALLADTIHNFGDVLNSVPLLIAFYLAGRMATRRYTYGFGKAEDIAGIVIVISIAVSAAVIFYESLRKLFAPEPIEAPLWTAAAAILGFLGNEAVAWLEIRTGRKIGSAAMVADGLHARTDGLTSLAVLVAVGGSVLGFPIIDPIIGLLISIVIVFIARDAVVTMWYRLMDAVDPELVDKVERAAKADGVHEINDTRIRWLGHRLNAELRITVDEDLSTRQSHAIAEDVRHKLLHELPQLSNVIVHVDPCGHGGDDPHASVAHHQLRQA